MTYHTGRAAGTDNLSAVQYRYIENLWGNVYEWVDGINFNNRMAYICTNPQNYADDTSEDYTNSGITLPYSGTWISSTGFVSLLQWAFVPDIAGGSDATYIPDGVITTTGWSTLYIGGDKSNGSTAGLFFYHAGSNSSHTYSGIGMRLIYRPQEVSQ